MARNKYYVSAHWRDLKRACHQRDSWKCTVPDCRETRPLICDHVETRPNVDHPTAFDVLTNVRTLCGRHDREIKEQDGGERRNGGIFRHRGSDIDGWPV